jgi:hypothetical protein
MASLIEALSANGDSLVRHPEMIATGVKISEFIDLMTDLDSERVELPLEDKRFVKWMKSGEIEIPGFPRNPTVEYTEDNFGKLPASTFGLVLYTNPLLDKINFQPAESEGLVAASYSHGWRGIPIESFHLLILNQQDTLAFNRQLEKHWELSDLRIGWICRDPLYYFSSKLTPVKSNLAIFSQPEH